MQTPRGVTIEVLAPRGADCATLAEDVADAMARAGIEAPEVTVRRVTDLPLDPRSGKLRRFVPLS